MEKVILTIQEADKILHDVKFALNSIACACEPFLGFTNRLNDAVRNLADAQERLSLAIEHLQKDDEPGK